VERAKPNGSARCFQHKAGCSAGIPMLWSSYYLTPEQAFCCVEQYCIFFRLMENEGICIPLLFPTMYCEFVNKGHDLSVQKCASCGSPAGHSVWTPQSTML